MKIVFQILSTIFPSLLTPTAFITTFLSFFIFYLNCLILLFLDILIKWLSAWYIFLCSYFDSRVISYFDLIELYLVESSFGEESKNLLHMRTSFSRSFYERYISFFGKAKSFFKCDFTSRIKSTKYSATLSDLLATRIKFKVGGPLACASYNHLAIWLKLYLLDIS